MAIVNITSFKPPVESPIVDDSKMLSRTWEQFFRKMSNLLFFIGDENFFDLVNNQAVAANIDGMKFDFQYESAIFIEYLVQRTTSTTELVHTGKIEVCWRPNSLTWDLYYSYLGPNVGVVFTITSTGQVRYTSTNIGGTPKISRIVFRKRPLAAKSSLYSKMG